MVTEGSARDRGCIQLGRYDRLYLKSRFISYYWLTLINRRLTTPGVSDNLKDGLTELRRKMGQLPDPREPPPSTLEIIGRSQQEQDWQRFFFHFLSSKAPHGLEEDLLRHILTGLSNRPDFDFSFSRFEVSNIKIETEVKTSNSGRVDAVMWLPDSWFICWELKLYSPESGAQSVAYVDADSFENIDLDKSASGVTDRYIYLARDSEFSAEACEFHTVSWEWVASELQDFLKDSHGQYPARTTAQLQDFIGTIQSELSMTEYQENEEEKAELYLDYYEEITAAQQSFDNRWIKYRDTWGRHLADELQEEQITDEQDLEGDNVVITIEIDGNQEEWVFHQGNDWAGIDKGGWKRHLGDPPKSNTESESEEVRCRFYHRFDLNRKLAIEDHILELQFWHGSDTPGEFMDTFKEDLHSKIDSGEVNVPSSVKTTGSRGKPITMRYDIPVGEDDDFFDAYTTALATAFKDLVIDHPEFISAIDDTIEEAYESY